jgi:hypothetical protein
MVETAMKDDAPLIHLVHHDGDMLLTLYEVLGAAGFHVGASTQAEDGLGHIARSLHEGSIKVSEESES